MSYHNDICEKVEKAAVAYLKSEPIANTPLVNIVGGLNPTLRVLPTVQCVCQTAEQDPPFDGTWNCKLEIRVRSNADRQDQADEDAHPLDEHRDRAGEIFSYFMVPDVMDRLTAALTDFTAFFVIPRTRSYDIVERSWVSILELEVHACGTDL